MSYERITADHPGALMVAHTLAGGGFACDAVHHNRESGCDNPKCFNYWPPKAESDRRKTASDIRLIRQIKALI